MIEPGVNTFHPQKLVFCRVTKFVPKFSSIDFTEQFRGIFKGDVKRSDGIESLLTWARADLILLHEREPPGCQRKKHEPCITAGKAVGSPCKDQRRKNCLTSSGSLKQEPMVGAASSRAGLKCPVGLASVRWDGQPRFDSVS
jgi:hypothetical protein